MVSVSLIAAFASIFFFVDSDVLQWSTGKLVAVLLVTQIGLEVISFLVPLCLEKMRAKRLPPGGPLIHKRDMWDFYFIIINKLQTPPFAVLYVHYLFGSRHARNISSGLTELTLLNTVPCFLLNFVVYDAMYSLFHRFLHWAPVYPYIHKHHHRQVAPMRGVDDAINTHWFEYVVGMYMHLWATIILDRLGLPQHALAVLAFVSVGSVLAALNHTLFDVNLPFSLFSSNEHHVHHRFSKFNYAQYTQLWDRILGTHAAWTEPPPQPINYGPERPAMCSPAACKAEWDKMRNDDAPEHCVVTGGNGLVGSRLVRLLAQRGARSVLSLDLTVPPSADPVDARDGMRADMRVKPGVIRWEKGDICDLEALVQHFRGATCVFHVAALVGPGFPKAAYEAVNNQGTRNVVEACKRAGVKYLVITSSPSTRFDGSDINNLTEAQMKAPALNKHLQEYSRTKALGEHFALANHGADLAVCAIAPHQVYGDDDQLFLPSLVSAATTGKLRIFGAGDNLISMCHADNVSHAHILAYKALVAGKCGGEYYIVTDNGAVNLWRSIDDAVIACGLPSLYSKFHLSLIILKPAAYAAAWLSVLLRRKKPFNLSPFTVRMLTMNRYMDITKICTEMGYRPIRSYEEAWPKAVEACRQKMEARGLIAPRKTV